MSVWTRWRNLAASDKGASMVEYALLVVLIALVAVVALTLVGNEVSTAFNDVADGFTP